MEGVLSTGRSRSSRPQYEREWPVDTAAQVIIVGPDTHRMTQWQRARLARDLAETLLALRAHPPGAAGPRRGR